MKIMDNIIEALIQEELKPALGCTEPICVAYTASVAGKYLLESNDRLATVDVELDKNVFKNGKDVSLPTPIPLRGNKFAAPIGALIAQPEKKLTILQNVDKDTCNRAIKFVENNKVRLTLNPNVTGLYVKVTLTGEKGTKVVTVSQNRHDQIVFISKNNEILLDVPAETTSTKKSYDLSKISSREFVEFLQAYFPSRAIIEKLQEGLEMNRKVMEAGLNGIGTGIGQKIIETGQTACSMNYIISRCAAAVDARMAGVSLPVMSVTGSGNQGLIIFLTHDLYTHSMKEPPVNLFQSLCLSIFLTAKIKHFAGRLSALCGCVIAAASASASGIAFLEKLDYPKIENAFNIMASDIMGLLCDGAKSSCALKAATGVNSLLRSVNLAKSGFSIPPLYGIIGKDMDETMVNIGKIASPGMEETDHEIVKILSAKDIS